MKPFGYGMLAGFLAVLFGLGLSFTILPLLAPDSAPAAPISRLVHLDEKLRFVRRHPGLDPAVLAVGSSVTWRQLSGEAFESPSDGAHHFLNGAVGHLQIHQTRALTRFYLAHFRNVRTVLVLVSLPDFGDCTDEPRRLFDSVDAARYAFDNWPDLYFQLRYFSPGRYVKTALALNQRRTPFTGDLYNDPYGSGPVNLPDEVDLGLRYGKLPIDPACVKELAGLARDMKEQDVRLVVVFAPIHPQYRVRYARDVGKLEDVALTLGRTRKRDPRRLQIINLVQDPSFGGKDFYDAFHLQWPAAKRLSKRIVKAIGGGSPVLQASDPSPVHDEGMRDKNYEH